MMSALFGGQTFVVNKHNRTYTINMRGKFLTLFFVIAATTLSYAQGTIRGVVKDGKTLEGLFNAVIRVKGQNNGTRTDFDGEYELSLPAGTYTLIYSLRGEGFLDQEREIAVTNEQVTVQDVDLSKDKTIELITVEVVATKSPIANSIAKDDERRDKEAGPTDGISSEQITQQGATNAVQAAQAVPGVTIEDGKSVYVRGLGDRYTKTILNGMEIPGLDPDRNSVQLDIFPTAVIDNMTIYKTFIPNWSGDYTGGLVNITTKDLPQKRYIYAKAGLGYNNFATFNSDYLTYNGGAIDFLGFDDGTRALPVRQGQEFPSPVLDDPNLTLLTKRFSKTMAASQASQFLNQNYSFGFGNRKVFRKELEPRKRITYGYNLVASYRNSHQFFEDAEYGEYRLESDADGPLIELEKSRVSKGQQSQNNILWTALAGQSVKFGRNKIDLTLFHTQNAMTSAAILREENFEDNPATLERTSLEFTQRSVSNANLAGRHYLDTNNKWTLEWKLSPTYSLISDPDIRATALSYESDADGNIISYDFDPAVGAQTRRIWRRLSEYNLGGRFDFTYKFDVDSTRKSKINFGGLNTYRARDFQILQYLFEYRNGDNVEFSEDPDWYFLDENIWTANSDQGMYVNAPTGALEPANNFNALQNIVGAYVMNEFPITDAFKATYGVRVENAQNWYTGQNNSGSINANDSLVLNEWSILPSVNLVYKIKHDADSMHKYGRKTNFRAAFATTVARPSFKEKSLAQIFDPLQGRTFNGNLNLLQTTIHNFDARWEHFFGRTELVSASAFYKQFIDPIELIAFNTAPDNVQPLNTGTAQVFGAEFEVRKSIGFSAENKQHLNLVIGANFSYIISRVDMRESMVPFGDSLVQEKDLRQQNAREGQVIGDYRQMYGQSPYIVNGFATFRNDSLGLIVNVNYNVQGKKLAVIGTGRIPDVFEQPFHSLNLKVSKTFGSEQQWQGSIAGRNLLLAKRQRVYESFEAQGTYVYNSWSPGVSVTASISYNLKGAKKQRARKN